MFFVKVYRQINLVMSNTSPKIVILGAGPCGLGAGWRLHELAIDTYDIYERESYVGGLATSFVDEQGFTWDIGGHVLHSHYPYFDSVFETVMRGDYLSHQREAWVWIYNRFVPYPFQNNIHRLPKEVYEECLLGLKELQKKGIPPDPTTFKEWILASFGEGIARHFLLPYNRKVWAYPPEDMNRVWVGDRVAKVDIERIERNYTEDKDDVSWGPNALFQFPSTGGTGEIWNRIAKPFQDHIHTGKRVVKIEAKKRIAHFSDNTTDSYDVLFTTIPIDSLVELITDVDFPKPKDSLHHSTVTIVGLGIKGQVPEQLKTKCWMYFPENKAPFFRATVFSNYAATNAPKGTWSLMTEVASSQYNPLPNEEIIAEVVQGAKNVKLIQKPDSIVSKWKFQAKYGYPTPTLSRDGYVDVVLPQLAKENIFSRGRFGAWKYEVSNQDHTFMQGVEWANHVINFEEEVTIFHPEIVNGAKKP